MVAAVHEHRMRRRKRPEAFARDAKRAHVAMRRQQHMQHDALREHPLAARQIDQFTYRLAGYARSLRRGLSRLVHRAKAFSCAQKEKRPEAHARAGR
jgi:hypothetical protein